MNGVASGEHGTGPRVRRAAPTDAEGLAELRWRLRTEVGRPLEDHDEFVERCRAWFTGALASADWLVWIAESAAGEAIGLVALQPVAKIPNPAGVAERLGYLTSFYVEPAHRNGGVGSELLEALVAEARALGLECVVLWPTERSLPLYRRFGFATPRRALELRLDD